MLALILVFGMIFMLGKLICFGLRASWCVMRIILSVIFGVFFFAALVYVSILLAAVALVVIVGILIFAAARAL